MIVKQHSAQPTTIPAPIRIEEDGRWRVQSVELVLDIDGFDGYRRGVIAETVNQSRTKKPDRLPSHFTLKSRLRVGPVDIDWFALSANSLRSKLKYCGAIRKKQSEYHLSIPVVNNAMFTGSDVEFDLVNGKPDCLSVSGTNR